MIITVAGMSLAGCTSFSDTFRTAPTPITIQLDSQPQGAEARTSVGPSCTTPCSVPVTVETGFSVTYTLDKYQPVTIPVQVVRNPGDLLTPSTTVINPNPVVAELVPIAPAKKKRRAAPRRPAASAAPAAVPASATNDTPFPAPSR
jgi:hypothetical protein